MKKILFVVIILLLLVPFSAAQDNQKGIRGDKEAIAEAEAMVETMGGI